MFVFFSMVLNEEKFLSLAVRSWLASDLVQAAVVVHGAVKDMRDYATPEGLSTDNTAHILEELAQEFGNRFLYKNLGFVPGKRELQNAALRMIHESSFNPEWVIIAGADELYRWQEIEKLAEQAKKTRANVLLYPFYHFWRRPDLIAVGSSWNVWMHRCYRYFNNLKFKTHSACPLPSGSQARIKDVHVYHYVGMQDAPNIEQRLNLYARRDGQRLDVVDTWTNWKWNEGTQWTHKGGKAKRFVGEHPDIISDQVWDMVPKLMVLPWVPWEIETMKKALICIDAEFFEDEDYQRIAKIVMENVGDVSFITMDRELIDTEFGDERVGGFNPTEFSKVDLNLNFGYPYLAGVRPRNLLVTKGGVNQQQAIGFVIVSPDGIESFEGLMALAEKEVPKYKPIIPEGIVPSSSKKLFVREAPVQVTATVGGISGQRQVVSLHNTTDQDITSKDTVVCSWLNAHGQPIKGAPKVSVPAPNCKVGQVKEMVVPIPRPPLTVGLLILDINVFSGNMPLNVGARVKMRFVG